MVANIIPESKYYNPNQNKFTGLMKVHSAFKLFIENQPISWEEMAAYSFNEPWKKSILDFLSNLLDSNTDIQAKTSGSTGSPKEILLLKESMTNSAFMTGAYLNLNAGDSALLCLSADFIAGKMMLTRAAILGLEIFCVEPKTQLSEVLVRTFTFCAMVPMQAMANIGNLSKIKKLIIGGGKLSLNDVEDLNQLKHDGIYQTFGMTETVSHIALKKLTNDFYTTLEGVEVSLSSERTLVIEAPRLLEKPLETNDLVELKSAKAFKWLGRLDNVINSGGYKIIPEKVENEIVKKVQLPLFVAGLADSQYGEKLVLFVEGEPFSLELSEFKSLDLHPFEIPKAVYFLKQFERTPTDKIQREKTVNQFLSSAK